MNSADEFNFVFFWKQNDTGIYGRRQDMLVKYLSAADEVRQVIHFDAPIKVTSLLKLLRFKTADQSRLIFFNTFSRALGRKHTPKVKNYTFVYRPQRGFWRLLFFFLQPNENYCAFVEKVLKKHEVGSRKTVFYVCPVNLEFPAIAHKLRPEFVVSDIIDDERAFIDSEKTKIRNLYEQNYREVLRVSDIVITNCEGAKNAFRDLNSDIKLIPNACELPEHSEKGQVPPRMLHLNRPILGYVGNLSSRIDVELLAKIAVEMPNSTLVLIGSAHLSREVLLLKKYANVQFLGVIPYERVKSYIDHFDVALIPHTLNDLTSSMNPLKLFVYCSRGIPVVTNNVANIEEMRKLVWVAANHDEFLIQIGKALKSSNSRPVPGSDSWELLQLNSWPARVKLLLQLIRRKKAENGFSQPEA